MSEAAASQPLEPPRVYLVHMVVFTLIVGVLVAVILPGLMDAFRSSPVLNGVIICTLFFGMFHSFRMVVRLFKEGVVEQVITDPAIHTLFGMYDLLPPEEPGCAKVWDFLGDLAPREAPSLSGEDPPHWSPAPVMHPPKEAEALLCRMEEGTILLAQAGGALHALDAACPRHGALMMGGRVSGVSWICPLGPGCVYDLRDGARLGGGAPLECHPVRTDGAGRILVGFGIPHAPQKPAF